MNCPKHPNQSDNVCPECSFEHGVNDGRDSFFRVDPGARVRICGNGHWWFSCRHGRWNCIHCDGWPCGDAKPIAPCGQCDVEWAEKALPHIRAADKALPNIHAMDKALPLIVQTNYVERLRLTPDGWICIGGITPETAPIAIRTMTGEVRINKPGEIAPHAQTFFECLNVIFPTLRAKWIEEERERCARIAESFAIPHAVVGPMIGEIVKRIRGGS